MKAQQRTWKFNLKGIFPFRFPFCSFTRENGFFGNGVQGGDRSGSIEYPAISRFDRQFCVWLRWSVVEIDSSDRRGEGKFRAAEEIGTYVLDVWYTKYYEEYILLILIIIHIIIIVIL